MEKTYVEWNIIDEYLSQARARTIIDHLKISGNRRVVVVDVGCGYRSKILHYLEKSNKLLKGIGLDKSTVTRKEGSIEYIQCDIEKQQFPLDSSYVDIVISLAVLEHLINFQFTIKEIYRTLTSNGVFFFTTPAPHSDVVLRALANLKIISKKEIDDHKVYFTKNGLKSLLFSAGFKNVDINYFQLGFNIIGKADK